MLSLPVAARSPLGPETVTSADTPAGSPVTTISRIPVPPSAQLGAEPPSPPTPPSSRSTSQLHPENAPAASRVAAKNKRDVTKLCMIVGLLRSRFDERHCTPRTKPG